jgi:hypothetical protein
MNSRTAPPRSAKDRLLGLVSLKRTIDKAKANNEGTLGEYHYDCPHDRPLLEFLGVDAQTFARKVKELKTDEKIGEWIDRELLSKKTPADIDRFNESRMQWHPEPGDSSYEYFAELRKQVAPQREEIVTWFDLFDLDEGRSVPVPTKLHARRS